MPHTCTECGSTNVVEDDLYSERTLVCEDCGSVVSGTNLTTTRSEEEQGTCVPYYASTEVTKQPCRNLIKGIKRVRALCRIFKFPGDMEAQTVALYEQAYAHPTFLMLRMAKKELLAGACLIAIARLNNLPVAMGTIGGLLEADSTQLGQVYQDLVKALNLQAAGSSIAALLENFCHGLKLTVQLVGEDFWESPERLTERATALMEVAGDTWLVTGRHPIRLSLATAYLAWQSLGPYSRMKVSLEEFCRLAKLPAGKGKGKVEGGYVVRQRIRELTDVLCKMGSQLPWLRGKPVDPRKITALVEDIVKYKRHLLSMALKDFEETLQANGNENVATAPVKPLTPPTETLPPSNITSNDHDTLLDKKQEANISQLHTSSSATLSVDAMVIPVMEAVLCEPSHVFAPPDGKCGPATQMEPATAAGPRARTRPAPTLCKRRKGLEPPAGRVAQCTEEEMKENEEEEEEEDNWGKRQLFVPPCVLLPKRRKLDRGPEVTGDEEILDEEIESYIRTPAELKDFIFTSRQVQDEEKLKEFVKKMTTDA